MCFIHSVSLSKMVKVIKQWLIFIIGMVDTAQFDVDSEEEETEAGLMAVGPRPATAKSMSKRPPTALRTLEVKCVKIRFTLLYFPKSEI